jgi:hypothetical protein
VIFSKPSAPTLVIERKHTALQQPFGTRPEVISVPQECIRLAEIRDGDRARAILIHSLLDHHKRIRREIASAAGVIQFGCVAEAVNSRIGPFEQKVTIARILLAVRKHEALQRCDVAPVRCAELQAPIGKKCAVGCKCFLIICCSLHGPQSGFQIVPNLPLLRSICSGQTHRFQSPQAWVCFGSPGRIRTCSLSVDTRETEKGAILFSEHKAASILALTSRLCQSHVCPEQTMFLRLFRAVQLGDDIDGWRVCWLGGWDKCRVLFVVMVKRVTDMPDINPRRGRARL